MILKAMAIVVLLAVLFLPAGCKSKQETAPNSPAATETSTGAAGNAQTGPDQTAVITTAKKFLDLHWEWTGKLESIADKVNSLYGDWTGGKITEEEYVTKMIELRKEVKELNRKTDLLTEFKLSDGDRQKANFEAVYRGYLAASKDVNDFVEYACTRPAEEIKAKYDILIKDRYQKDLAALKSALQK